MIGFARMDRIRNEYIRGTVKWDPQRKMLKKTSRNHNHVVLSKYREEGVCRKNGNFSQVGEKDQV